MNDYIFGNRMRSLRREAGLSQNELAVKLGVTGKAVSNWECGKSKPVTKTLQKLSALYSISVEELLLQREVLPKCIKKIVITGGPSAGKTTAMSKMEAAISYLGYTVLFVPETATELITGGVAPGTCGSNLDFQLCQMQLQLEKERIFYQAAQSMEAEKLLIVCDRGALDNRAYMSELEFSTVLRKLGLREVELRDNYDAVFHLVTAAKGAEEFYTTKNNAARSESVAEAAELDDKLLAAWTGHPHLRVIDNSSDFQQKLQRLFTEITAFLGEPEPMEIERKYLIEYPDIAWLESYPTCRKIEIIQTYLKTDNDEELRIRQRGSKGVYLYYETRKRTITGQKRVETERRLSQEEYLAMLMRADIGKRQIRKTRYCLTYENQYFEIDIYPFWKDKAIAEIELSNEKAEIVFPKQLKVIKEVTDDPSYKNVSLATVVTD